MEVEKSINTVMVDLKNSKKFLIILLILNFFLFPKILNTSSVPHQAYSWYLTGYLAYLRGEYEKAIECYKNSISISPNFAPPYLELANIFIEGGDYETAISILEQAEKFILTSSILERLSQLYIAMDKKEKAIKTLEKLSKVDSTNAIIFYKLGILYEEAGNKEKAIQNYKKSYSLNTNFGEPLKGLYDLYFQLSDEENVLNCALKLSQLYPDNLKLKYVVALLYQATGNYKKAEYFFKNLLDLLSSKKEIKYNFGSDSIYHFKKPEDYILARLTELYFVTDNKRVYKLIKKLKNEIKSAPTVEGIFYFLNHKYKKAENLFNKILKNDPYNIVANYGLYKIYSRTKNNKKLKKVLKRLVKVHFSNQNYKEAERFAKKLLKIDKNNSAEYLMYLAIIYNETGEKEKELETYKKILKLKPGDIDVLSMIAALYVGLGNSEEAINTYKEILKKEPENVPAITMLASLLSSMGKYNEAEKYILKALKLEPDNAEIYLLSGIFYVKQKKYKKALKYLKKGEKIKPSPDIYFYMAVCHDELNDIDKAIESLEKAHKLEPDSPEVCNYLAYLYALKGINLQKGLKLVNKALEIKENDFAYLDTLGWLYYKMEEYDRAITILKKAIEIMEDSPVKDSVVYEHLGDVYVKTGEIEKAIKNYEKALKLNKDKKIEEKLQKIKPK